MLPPIVITIAITPGAIIAITVLVIAMLAFRLALRKRPPTPRRHGLREL